MSVSLVVPVYKIKEEYLRKCLDSILGQTDNDWEAILVDDGSPDNSGMICDEYAAKDSRITAVHQDNQGVSVARNTGIDRAKYEWVTFIDPDDWIDEKAVELINEQLRKNNPDILAFGYAREFKNLSRPEALLDEDCKIPDELISNMRLAPLYHLRINNAIYKYTVNAIWNKVYKVAYLNEHHIRFEPSARKGQDRVFNLYALDKTDSIYYLNQLLYHYRNDNEDSIVNRYNPNTVKYSQAVLKLMLNWIKQNDKPQIYMDLLYCWTCTRLQEYMKLYYFNKKRDVPYKVVKREIDELLSSELYTTAFREVDKTILSREENIFLFFVKKRMYFVCKMLISGREYLKHLKNKG